MMNIKKWGMWLAFISIVICIGCSKRITVDEIEETPVPVRTMMEKALADLGLMTEIYGSSELKIQSSPLVDRTGTEWKKGGELSREITDKIKNAVSAIGGKITYIPYDPVFTHVQMLQYDADTKERLLPDVVLQGEITRFDPCLEHEDSRGCHASLVFDFVDFHTLAAISQVRTENSVEVGKAKERKKLSVMLAGPSYQKDGTIERVNGGAQAVQMLVELSVIQLIGKHLSLPYWTLLHSKKADPVVLDSLKHTYYKMNEAERISKIQELLFLHGYDVTPSGVMNLETKIALQDYENTQTLFHRPVDPELFFKLYFSLPITDETLERRFELDRIQKSA